MTEEPCASENPFRASRVFRLEQVCDQFEAAWKGAASTGQRPRLEDYLADVAEPELPCFLRELLLVELAYRHRRGESPLSEEYRLRFPAHAELIADAFREAGVYLSGDVDSSCQSVQTVRNSQQAQEADQPVHLGRYRITGKLGRGGFGVVYQGYDDDLRRVVAIKVPNPSRLAHPRDLETYFSEARILASLDHPHIVPVYDVGTTDDGFCFIVSKFIEGCDLAGRIHEGRPSFIQSAQWVATIADALHYAHRRGLVHRDIKPANILLDSSGKAIVADFGLALKEEDFGRGVALAGTPSYMSPEQARGEGHRVDGRSDIFSLGVLFYELLTGRRPFKGETRDALFEEIIAVEARPPRQVDDSIPKELERICLKAMAKRISDRYTTAEDMAVDLQHFLNHAPQEKFADRAGVAIPAPFTATLRDGLTPTTPVKIIPKGLRSFDANDADFFLDLLPGPRDRDGLPESIRFWKTASEKTDPDKTFTVGLIYGPSGCGKSSLVKAGLLPRLADHVTAIYIEATAAETEARLLNALRKNCPGLPGDLGLFETLADLRRGRFAIADKKVLIVLDQFEQWLHAKRGEQHHELVQALRQCDGERVQCIVMVRDDFWMAATRFMDSLEVRLIQGANTAAVDLFDPRHARKVLRAFGRAFAALPELDRDLTKEQEAFLQQAVAELAQEGKVISVRLALFAEMVKSKPWTPATLRQMGGMAGAGATFLEETFAASTAPPQHRFHQRAAQAILKALLPETGTDIKGRMRSRQELLDASGYGHRARDFEELLRILDSEMRLLTPTDPEGADGERSAQKAAGKYYQLTHDYLVPSLREWLSRKQTETRRGRAELRLAERAAAWNAKPENRLLPAWWEELNIRVFTRRRYWTAGERKMMQKASRYHAKQGLVFAACSLLLAWACWEGYGSLQAEKLVESIVSAETVDVPPLVARLSNYRRWANSLLLPHLQNAAEDSKKRLHASLAMISVDPGQVDYLYQRLLNAAPQDVSVIRAAVRAHKEELIPRLWSVVEQPDKGRENQRLRAACALASFDPDNSRWSKASRLVATDLVGVPSVFVAHWMEALRPVRAQLLAPLSAIFRDTKRREKERAVATDILADYAARQPALLADLIVDADAQQYPVLLLKLKAHGEDAFTLMEEVLKKQLSPDWKDAPLNPAWVDPDSSLIGQLEAAYGMLDKHFALCQTMPLEEFVKTAQGLRRSGYRPIRFRPYAVGKAVQVAAVWTRDGRDWQLAYDGSADDIQAKDKAWRTKGLMPVDVAGYVVDASATGSQTERYAALWSQPAAKGEEARTYVGVSEATHNAKEASLAGGGYQPWSYQVLIGQDGRQWHSAVWRKAAVKFSIRTLAGEEAAYEQQLTPSQLQIDVGLARLAVPPNNKQAYSQQLMQADRDLQTKPGDTAALLARARAHLLFGHDPEAISDLSQVIKKMPKEGPEAYRLRALAHARRGEAAGAHQDLTAFQNLSDSPGAKLCLAAAVGAHHGGDEEAMKRLEAAITQHPKDSDFLSEAARAYAIAARVVMRQQHADRAKVYADRAAALLQDAVANGYAEYRNLQTDEDLDAIREHPDFQALLSQGHLDRQYTAVWHGSATFTSEESHGLDPQRHLQRCRELAGHGYRPAAVAVAWMGEGKPLLTASVWQQPVVPEAEREALAKRQANAAVALLHLGRADYLWPLLRHSPDPRLRTYLIHRLGPLGTDPQMLIQRLEEEPDVSVRRALILCLGEFVEEQLSANARKPVTAWLLQAYRTHADSGLHSAAEWVLRRWGHGRELAKIDQELVSKEPSDGRSWYVNSAGQIMVSVRDPEVFLMGSPGYDRYRRSPELEKLHLVRIPRSFAMATKEVTYAQYQGFVQSHPGARRIPVTLMNPDPDCPAYLSWFEAAQYCRWLSEKEGVREDQMCFPPVEEIKEGMELPADYLTRTGYRLPTGAEWEYACRANALTSRAYGASDDMLQYYGWYVENAKQRTYPGGLLKPNDLGLFDMYGNVWEWCLDRKLPYKLGPNGQPRVDREHWYVIVDKQGKDHIARGGSCFGGAEFLRSASHSWNPPSTPSAGLGVRVARTCP